MKRRVLLLLLLLVAGAIVNVAVAWGCTYVSSFRHNRVDIGQSEAMSIVFPDGQSQFDSFSAFQNCYIGFVQTRVHASWHDREHGYKFYITTDDGWSAGWPCDALIGWTRWLDDEEPTSEWCNTWMDAHNNFRVFPYCPLWPGFAINTVFYAALLWLLFAAPLALRRRRRIKRGLCPKCAYDLRGTPEATACPECGGSLSKREHA